MFFIDKNLCIDCGMCVKVCPMGVFYRKKDGSLAIGPTRCLSCFHCTAICPTGAITFEDREAPAYDEAAVKRAQEAKKAPKQPCSCPGSRSHAISRASGKEPVMKQTLPSQLRQWPVQIKLVPVNAPYFDGANLLVAADCTAYTYANFHQEFMRNRITLIGCPKLDEGDYAQKLAAILAGNNIKSLTIVRMEVPCCGGIENAAKRALQASGKFIPWQVVTISTDGRILD